MSWRRKKLRKLYRKLKSHSFQEIGREKERGRDELRATEAENGPHHQLQESAWPSAASCSIQKDREMASVAFQMRTEMRVLLLQVIRSLAYKTPTDPAALTRWMPPRLTALIEKVRSKNRSNLSRKSKKLCSPQKKGGRIASDCPGKVTYWNVNIHSIESFLDFMKHCQRPGRTHVIRIFPNLVELIHNQ